MEPQISPARRPNIGRLSMPGRNLRHLRNLWLKQDGEDSVTVILES
jgi:hypothetical protein